MTDPTEPTGLTISGQQMGNAGGCSCIRSVYRDGLVVARCYGESDAEAFKVAQGVVESAAKDAEITRLKQMIDHYETTAQGTRYSDAEAFRRAETAEAEVAALREALRPFAEEGEYYLGKQAPDGDDAASAEYLKKRRDIEPAFGDVTVGDFRRAARLLSPAEPSPETAKDQGAAS